MRFLKQVMAVLGTVTMIALLVALVAPKATHAVVAALVQIVPNGTTHVLQNESQIVSLYCPNYTASRAYCESLDATGVPSGANYTVPTGYTLVITDYEWNFSGETAGNVYCDALVVYAGLYTLTNYQNCGVAGTDLVVTGQSHYTTGFRVASGQVIVDSQASHGYGEATAQGYLVPN